MAGASHEAAVQSYGLGKEAGHVHTCANRLLHVGPFPANFLHVDRGLGKERARLLLLVGSVVPLGVEFIQHGRAKVVTLIHERQLPAWGNALAAQHETLHQGLHHIVGA